MRLPAPTHLVVGFQHRAEAERFRKEFGERLGKFGLELHPEKTRLIEFCRFAENNRKRQGEGKPGTFTFLGFTHYCGKTRNGIFTIWRRTASKRIRAKLQAIRQTLRTRMHEPMGRVGEWLRRVVDGYCLYHAVPGNLSSLSVFRYRLCRMWRQVLRRRSQKRRLNWENLNRLFERWLPHPRVVHPYPSARFDATHRKIGAVCVSSARTDLCGGRSAMTVPTVTPK